MRSFDFGSNSNTDRYRKENRMSRMVCPACGGPETTTPECPRCEGSGLITMNTEIDQLTSRLRAEKILRQRLDDTWKEAVAIASQALDELESYVKDQSVNRDEVPELFKIGELLMKAYDLRPQEYSPFLIGDQDTNLETVLQRVVGMVERIDRRLTATEDQLKADRITAEMNDEVTG